MNSDSTIDPHILTKFSMWVHLETILLIFLARFACDCLLCAFCSVAKNHFFVCTRITDSSRNNTHTYR